MTEAECSYGSACTYRCDLTTFNPAFSAKTCAGSLAHTCKPVPYMGDCEVTCPDSVNDADYCSSYVLDTCRDNIEVLDPLSDCSAPVKKTGELKSGETCFGVEGNLSNLSVKVSGTATCDGCTLACPETPRLAVWECRDPGYIACFGNQQPERVLARGYERSCSVSCGTYVIPAAITSDVFPPEDTGNLACASWTEEEICNGIVGANVIDNCGRSTQCAPSKYTPISTDTNLVPMNVVLALLSALGGVYIIGVILYLFHCGRGDVRKWRKEKKLRNM